MKLTTLQIPQAPNRWASFCLALLIAGFVLMAIVPPFQAPDEYDHVKRAYLLSQGQLLLHSVDGSSSGGQIDTGLLSYMDHFTPLKGNAGRKLSSDEAIDAGGIHWTNVSSFQSPVGTAYYFPALYLPQAIGLGIGKALDLSVGQSYRLSRFLAISTCLILLICAFRIYPPPLFVLAVLALPMNVFLMSAAALDGLATCMAILAISAFMRLIADGPRVSSKVIYVLGISIALVSACRANLLPMLLFPFVAWWLVRRRPVLIGAIAIMSLVLAWTMYTVKFTVYPPGPRHIDHAGRLIGYITHPFEFLGIVYTTLTTPSIVNFYFVSFIGVLGWLDAPFPATFYYSMAALLALMGILSLNRRVITTHPGYRALIGVCALGAVLMTFLALLVQWTVGPATTVDGVQGRYFVIPVLMCAYALFGDDKAEAGITEKIRLGVLIMIFALTIYGSSLLMATRYYMPATQPDPDVVVTLHPSQVLTHDRPIPVRFSAAQTSSPAEIAEISLRFGTYMSSHPGHAALRLWTNDGQKITVSFQLPELVDNAYRSFKLDGKRYVGGEIVSEGGQGVSIYEAQVGNLSTSDCVLIRTTDDRSLLTPGCPQP